MDDLIAILNAEKSEEGLTSSELLDKLGTEDTVFYRQRLLRKLKTEIKAGHVVCGRAIRFRIDGKPMQVPVYRMVDRA